MTATLGMIPNEAIKYKCLIAKWYQAWELRQQKMTFKQIGKIMGITGSRADVLSNFIDFKIKYQKQRRISQELKLLIKKYIAKDF